MQGPSGENAVFSFRGDARLYIIVSVWASLFIVLGAAITIKSPDQWSFLAIPIGGLVAFFAGLSYLRFEIGRDYFYYRNLSGSRRFRFSDLERAYFRPLRGAASVGASFWAQPKGGRPSQINLWTFPIEAAARLFGALDRFGIPVEIPDVWGCQRMAAQIRECQRKLEQKPSSP